MAIDSSMLDAMLGTFRNMAKDLVEKKPSGPAYEKMTQALERMEQLGKEMDDFAAFQAKMMTEGLMMEFSTQYGIVMGELAKPQGGGDGGGYDDKALLNQTLNAYRDAVKRLRDAKQEAKDMAGSDADKHEIETLIQNESIIKAIEDLVKFGESGVNYPTFLRVMMEKGLDKAMEGAAVLQNTLEYDLGWAKAINWTPAHVQEKEEILAKFHELAAKSVFKVPDSLQFELARQKIEHRHEPAQIKFRAIVERWERILNCIDDWAMAHTKFAPVLDPWKAAGSSSAIKEAIEESKDCDPGYLKVRERILKENFAIGFKEIFSHETFLHEVKNYRLSQSQEYIEFLASKVYPQCLPGKHLDGGLVSELEKLYEEKKLFNPETYKPAEKTQAHYDSIFGAGAYLKKFSAPERNDSKARPWDLANFRV